MDNKNNITKKHYKALNPQEAINVLKEKFPQYNFDKSQYTTAQAKITVICPKHGEFKYSYFRAKTEGEKFKVLCPRCNPYGTSIAETEIYDSLKERYPNLKITNKNRSIIKSPNKSNHYEIDILLEDEKGILLAIEFNGIYWHSDELINKRTDGYFKTAEEYHNYKTNECKKQNIELIHISEEDYLDNKDGVLNMLYTKIDKI